MRTSWTACRNPLPSRDGRAPHRQPPGAGPKAGVVHLPGLGPCVRDASPRAGAAQAPRRGACAGGAGPGPGVDMSHRGRAMAMGSCRRQPHASQSIHVPAPAGGRGTTNCTTWPWAGAASGTSSTSRCPASCAWAARWSRCPSGPMTSLQPALQAHAPLVSPADYARLLDWAVATLQISDSRRLIILGTVPPLEMYPGCRTWPGPRRRWARDTIDAYNRAVREIAHRRRCVLWELPSVPAAMFQSDAFHPDADGNQVLANSLRPLLPQGPAPSPRPWIQDDEPTTFLPQRDPGGRRMVGRASAQVAIQE